MSRQNFCIYGQVLRQVCYTSYPLSVAFTAVGILLISSDKLASNRDVTMRTDETIALSSQEALDLLERHSRQPRFFLGMKVTQEYTRHTGTAA